MPQGGWGDLSPLDPQETPDANQRAQILHPTHSDHTHRRSYLTCKVCDRGTLSSKRVFRLSGPAVVIGFILLIPSILGIICSVLMFVGVNVAAVAYKENESNNQASETNQPFQSTFDANFRRNCARSFKQSYIRATGALAPLPLTEQYCECALSTFKETGSETVAAQTCTQRVKDGTLDTLGQDVDALYSGDISHGRQASAAMNPFRAALSVFGSGFAFALGITSFVGGLLGWLLVMRKRVLQCDLCGAVVNAS